MESNVTPATVASSHSGTPADPAVVIVPAVPAAPAQSDDPTRSTDSAMSAGSTPDSSLQTALGKTEIDDSVVAKVAGIAAREIAGVYALGGGAARALGAIRGAMNTADPAQGISVEVDGENVTIDVVMVAEYPAPLEALTDDVRTAIIAAVEDLVGLEVIAVNITVADIHLASEDDEATLVNRASDAASTATPAAL